MNAFDKVIGYKATKRELLQLCDMLRNREIYEEMGARLPHGLLLYGDPGLGKTLLARCFVEESGLHTITVRRDKGGDAFIDGITQASASARMEGFDRDPAEEFLRDIATMDMQDISRFYQEQISGRPVVYVIAGNRKRIDMNKLAEYGTIVKVKKKDIYK